MESRQSSFIKEISNGVVANLTQEVPHEKNTYQLKLTWDQTSTIWAEINSALYDIQLSKTQESILNKLDESKKIEFASNLIGELNFKKDFSLFTKKNKIKASGLTELYYDNLIFDLSEFKEQQFWNSWLLKPFFGSDKPLSKDLKTRFNMSVVKARKELIIAVYCKTIANFGNHEDHLALARELQIPENQIIAAMRKPYGNISFFSSAKEINSKAYFSYQRHIFSALLGAKVISSAFKNLPLDMGHEINFFVKPRDINSLASVNKSAAETKHDTVMEYGEKYFRKRI